MTHMVMSDQFNGPLELLLELSERRKVELDQISISAITRDYLARLGDLAAVRPHEVAEFLQLGCRLTCIKSALLLPLPASAESAQDLRRLAQELADYQRFRAAGANLALLARTPSYVRPQAERPAQSSPALPANVTAMALRAAFSAVLARQTPSVRRPPASAGLSQREASQRLTARLHQGPFALERLLDLVPGRANVIMLFSALLELLKSGQVRASVGASGDIMIASAGA